MYIFCWLSINIHLDYDYLIEKIHWKQNTIKKNKREMYIGKLKWQSTGLPFFWMQQFCVLNHMMMMMIKSGEKSIIISILSITITIMTMLMSKGAFPKKKNHYNHSLIPFTYSFVITDTIDNQWLTWHLFILFHSKKLYYNQPVMSDY